MDVRVCVLVYPRMCVSAFGGLHVDDCVCVFVIWMCMVSCFIGRRCYATFFHFWISCCEVSSCGSAFILFPVRIELNLSSMYTRV